MCAAGRTTIPGRSGLPATAPPPTPFAGDGNGFKLGGGYAPGPHRVLRCLSFGHPHTGFDQNGNSAGLTLDQNTAWANVTCNFNLNHNAITQGVHVARNNLSLDGAVTIPGSAIQTNNSWQVLTSASTNDVLSVDPAFLLAPRRDDGSLPETPFLRPVPDGRLLDNGAALGEPFFGSAPDLGAFESPAW